MDGEIGVPSALQDAKWEWDLPIFHGEEECPLCHFPNVMFFVEKCWTCREQILVFCPKCRRITCMNSGSSWDEGGIR